MNTTLAVPEISPLVLQMSPAIEMTDEQFFDFCQQNRDYRIERTAKGEIIIMPPTGSETGNRNFDLIIQLGIWTRQNKTGIGFDSSTGFILPNGAIKSSDAAWIKLEKWHRITPEQQQKFAPICPDFVIELRSPSDPLKALQSKLQEYIENGTALGWLIDRKQRQVYIYRPDRPVECLNNPTTLSEDSLLPGFVLDLSTIW
ncbi:Uma2 family endonuclease [Phormidium pseudopriestleyi FRX01]|uniref:Uma2 family endonuclease n=1 Tax=Phormidium pseudopriestleyi FRX01 TaxID=1759528 RepID=A0ABS3FVY3_9CYAN|nr:Uma2 family endonuclease [Phormidium pseudopriestleyi]MBO0350933.1 Uma2 family endonuclease [Phormidium pseudopriestleyi FRX01]